MSPTADVLFARDTGVLLHPTSLPGSHGVGDLGPVAHWWVRRLADSGQTLWQVLPLNPTEAGESPYRSPSSFAGHPLLLGMLPLVHDGLLTSPENDRLSLPPSDRVDFERARAAKGELLGIAITRLLEAPEHAGMRASFERFSRAERGWLRDHALFFALRARFEGAAWTEWPAPYRDRDPDTLAAAAEELGDEIRRTEVEQFLFFRQWRALREVARAHGVRIVGDLPIFVAPDSVDVWAHPTLYQLDDRGAPTVVSGVPPDYFSEEGQLWGNPLYAWPRHEATGFAWWRERVRHLLRFVDVARIDHFRGLQACWEVPAGAETAVDGCWVEAPGSALLARLGEDLGAPLPLIAEDLGLITDEVVALRESFALPGMRVLQFAFGDDPDARVFRPEAYVQNCVAYTGTHDNDTMPGWFGGEPSTTRTADEIAAERRRLLECLGTTGDEIHWECIEALLRSAAGAVVFPLQDVLGLGSEGRMNVPGQPVGNWAWRVESLDVLEAPLRRLGALTRSAGRGPSDRRGS